MNTCDLKTIIWYTDAISALVRAAEPLRVAIEDANRRGDVELKRYLLLTYDPLVTKIKACVSKGARDEDWTARELGARDADLLARLVTPKEAQS